MVFPTERKLEARAQAVIGDERVLAAGLFQPYGSGVAAVGGGVGGAAGGEIAHLPGLASGVLSAAAAFAAQRGLAAAEHLPPWTALALTASRIFAFDATEAGGLAATDHFGEPFQVWERSGVAVHVSRYILSFALTIEDPQTATSWSFKGNELYKVGGKLVAHLLAEPVQA
jgi:hypothetical protein